MNPQELCLLVKHYVWFHGNANARIVVLLSGFVTRCGSTGGMDLVMTMLVMNVVSKSTQPRP